MNISVNNFATPYNAWYTQKQRKRLNIQNENEVQEIPLDQFFEREMNNVDEMLEFRIRHEKISNMMSLMTLTQLMRKALGNSMRKMSELNRFQSDEKNLEILSEMRKDFGHPSFRNYLAFIKSQCGENNSELSLLQTEQSLVKLIDELMISFSNKTQNVEQIYHILEQRIEELDLEIKDKQNYIQNFQESLISTQNQEGVLRKIGEFLEKYTKTFRPRMSGLIFRFLNSNIKNQLG